uniref:Putative secreted protein n=1 Tax=Ixodes ricinus TaxID=34613 RepID=A0A6B0UVM9_IXORI
MHFLFAFKSRVARFADASVAGTLGACTVHRHIASACGVHRGWDSRTLQGRGGCGTNLLRHPNTPELCRASSFFFHDFSFNCAPQLDDWATKPVKAAPWKVPVFRWGSRRVGAWAKKSIISSCIIPFFFCNASQKFFWNGAMSAAACCGALC